MQILIFGGTVFLSRTVVQTALADGHQVTTISRGKTGTPVDGAESIIGDRADAATVDRLAGRTFDLVFDTGYTPAAVRAAAERLADSAGHYVFVSSINAYPGWPTSADYRAGGSFDGDPDAVGDELPPGIGADQAYGWRKVGAERAVLRSFGLERTSILRCGLIVGPQDGIGRLPWWLHRIAAGGRIPAPGRPDDGLRMIDARDIADFALQRPAGTFEVSGPAGQTTRGELFKLMRIATGVGDRAEFVWLEPAAIAQVEVEGWTELPLWIPPDEAPGLFAHDTTAAESAGLAARPMADTVADTWAWMQSLADTPAGPWQPSDRTPGMSTAQEQQLLSL